MPLSKYKISDKYSAVRKFTDREKPIKIFQKSLNDFVYDRQLLKVLVFYGVGGIGKTTLLKYLKTRLLTKIENNQIEDIKPIFISLDAFEFNTPTDILISIRNEVEDPCILFDYALLRYWASVGNSPLDIKKKSIEENSIIWDILGALGKWGGVPLPSKTIRRGFKKVKTKYRKSYSKFKNELIKIDQLEAIEIYKRLPYYLGRGINNTYEKKKYRHIIFLDSYERMLKKFDKKSVETDADEWARELIGSSEVGLFILGSRERIKWDEKNKEWEEYLDQHILGSLTSKDADYFLKSIPIKEESIRNEIIETSKGLPLFLDLCVDIYLDKKSREEKLKPEDFKMAENEVINNFMKNLSRGEEETTKIFSVVNFFNFDLFKYLIKKFNINYPVTLFDEFIERSFIVKIDGKNNLYKIHDLIREHILNDLDPKLKYRTVKYTIKFLNENKARYELDFLRKNFGHLLSMLNMDLKYRENDMKNILDLGFYLIDNGLWVEAGKALDEVSETKLLEDNLLRNGLNLLKGVYVRRIGQLGKAYEILNKIDNEKLGIYDTLTKFYTANVIRLMGDYTKAEQRYKKLVNSVTYNKETEMVYSKINRQWADLLFLKGEFVKSLDILESLLDKTDDDLERAETIRVIGHIYRFNMMLDKAQNKYEKALEIAENLNAVGLIGKLHTNLTETFAWKDPKKALKIGKESINKNQKLDAKIETGKTFAALSLASLLKGESSQASKYSKKAKKIQLDVGYQSGVLFAELAEIFNRICNESSDEIFEKKKDIDRLINEIDVYKFLKLPIYVHLEDQSAIQNQKNNINWLDFEKTLKSYENMIDQIEEC